VLSNQDSSLLRFRLHWLITSRRNSRLGTAAISGATESGDNQNNDKPDPEKPEGAPEKYNLGRKGVELDQEALKGFEPLARDRNLTNEQAQKMVDLYGEKLLPQIQKQQTEAWRRKRLSNGPLTSKPTKKSAVTSSFPASALRSALWTSSVRLN
jgi:hypothetical protein